ncbi:MAG: aminoacyl-histidine dipeptidase [Eubacterium sp.]
MGVLSELEPIKVFKYFEEICSIPHGSGNVKQISDYLVDFAKKHSLKYRQDEKYNVIIWKNGSKGYETSEPVILQGHIDMVAVKTAGCEKDMEKEGLDLEIDGDLISAKGTSLGGDDGIAVAYSLAVLEDESIAHPPIEAIFTVDEEIGMLGADFIDVSDLKGRIFMNMDSEDEGVFTVSCAGGATVTCSIPYKTEPVNASIIEIKIEGFTGGHSGVKIDKGRVNSNCAMGRILLNLFQNLGIRLVTVNGGEKDNAIAKMSEAAIGVLPETVDKAKKIIHDTFNEIKEEYKFTDPDAELIMNVMDSDIVEVFSGPATLATIISLVNMPNGIQRMNPEIEGLVQTSLNLGILRTEKDAVKLSYAVRSSSESEKRFLIERLRSLTEIFGGTVEVTGVYPGWEYKADSRLRDVMVGAYKELYGKEPVVEGIHAGLECGIFASKLSGLDAVSFGPQMQNIHTTNEVLSISSTKRTWQLVLRTLEALK